MTLTLEQELAARAPGSVAVTAGAGTGKTRMLAERYLHHVREHRLSPLSVVAVTFTEKAAAELRSRIRSTLVTNVADDDVIAEVEAAQISTIHALAARICRDFHDLAGISADFAILDETESPLWFGEKFAEAVGQLSLEIVDAIGHRKLIWLLKELLKDPMASAKALTHQGDGWQSSLEKSQTSAKDVLLRCAEWNEVCKAIDECSGQPGDKLEEIRAALQGLISLDQMDVDILAVNSLLKGFKSTSGSAGKWPAADLARMRKCIFAFKERVKAAAEICNLRFGTIDDELAFRLPLLAEAFRQVRKHIADAKVREKVLDFNDLEHYAIKILEDEAARQYYSARWKAFLIDEFQDTNPVQAEIIGRLAKNALISIVGDEKQSIYGFRGADVEVFSRVRDEIIAGGGASISLDRTFRAHSGLVSVMNESFEPILGDLHQELMAEKNESSFPAPFMRFAAVEEQKGISEQDRRVLEARYIADRVDELNRQGVPYSQIAILSRRWEPLNTYLDVLSARGIPAVNAGGGSLLSTIEARDVYSLLQFVADRHDDIALVSLLRGPFFAFSDRTLYESAKYLTEGSSWWAHINQLDGYALAVDTLEEILRVSENRSAETVVRIADKLTGYSAVIANMPQGERRLADLEGVIEVLRKLALRGHGDVFGVVRYLRELYKTDIALPRPAVDPGDAVVLMTIHRAKGLEWPVVFVPDLSSPAGGGSLPILIDPDLGVGFKADDDDSSKQEPVIYALIKARRRARELDEARRILYVGITRAKDKVYLTARKDKGYDIDILRPGLAAAGIENEVIEYDSSKTIAPAPGLSPEPEIPSLIDIEPVAACISDLPVTALTVFAACPARFKWQFIERHPGVHEGDGKAMRIGTLAHLALEHGIPSAEALRALDPSAGTDEIDRAFTLASAFHGDLYEQVRRPNVLKEMRFRESFGPIMLTGAADLVGDDFVLDYKTDAIMDPDTHRFQLWAYAKALGKRRALIAYLAHSELYEFKEDDLTSIDTEAVDLIARISKGDHAPTPSAKACRFCAYQEICAARYTGEFDDDTN